MKMIIALLFVATIALTGCMKSIESSFCPIDRAGGIPSFSEQNFGGIPSATQITYLHEKPIEFTGRVVSISDNSSKLADDPAIVPYTILFDLVKGTIPGYPHAKQFSLDPQRSPGVDSIGRFDKGQEVVFLGRPSGGAPYGMMNVPSFDELKNSPTSGLTLP